MTGKVDAYSLLVDCKGLNLVLSVAAKLLDHQLDTLGEIAAGMCALNLHSDQSEKEQAADPLSRKRKKKPTKKPGLRAPRCGQMDA